MTHTHTHDQRVAAAACRRNPCKLRVADWRRIRSVHWRHDFSFECASSPPSLDPSLCHAPITRHKALQSCLPGLYGSTTLRGHIRSTWLLGNRRGFRFISALPFGIFAFLVLSISRRMRLDCACAELFPRRAYSLLNPTSAAFPFRITGMPFVQAAKDMIGATGADANMHEDAPSAIISLSWIFLIVPCVFLVAAFAWIMIKFSEPSEFPQQMVSDTPSTTQTTRTAKVTKKRKSCSMLSANHSPTQEPAAYRMRRRMQPLAAHGRSTASSAPLPEAARSTLPIRIPTAPTHPRQSGPSHHQNRSVPALFSIPNPIELSEAKPQRSSHSTVTA